MTSHLFTAEKAKQYRSRKLTPEQRKELGIENGQAKHGWQWGTKDKRMRAKFITLLKRVGKPSQAWQLLDDLELWPDDKRPPKLGDPYPYTRWLKAAEDGVQPDKKTQTVIDQRYDAYMGEALLRASTVAAETVVDQFQKVQDGSFNPKYGGITQTAGNVASFAYEKVMNVRRARRQGNETVFGNVSIVVAPAQAKQLPDGKVIEGEVREIA